MKSLFAFFIVIFIISTIIFIEIGCQHHTDIEVVNPVLNVIEIPKEGFVFRTHGDVHLKKGSRYCEILVNDEVKFGDIIRIRKN